MHRSWRRLFIRPRTARHNTKLSKRCSTHVSLPRFWRFRAIFSFNPQEESLIGESSVIVVNDVRHELYPEFLQRTVPYFFIFDKVRHCYKWANVAFIQARTTKRFVLTREHDNCKSAFRRQKAVGRKNVAILPRAGLFRKFYLSREAIVRIFTSRSRPYIATETTVTAHYKCPLRFAPPSLHVFSKRTSQGHLA